MENYTATETYTLPSKGLIYPPGMVAPELTIRSMTTVEEMRRLSPTISPYKHMCDIIDSCVVDGLKMSSYDLCLGDYLFLLHKLRIVTYGSDYQMYTKCPLCGQTTLSTVDLDTLNVIEYNEEEFAKYSSFTLPITNKTISIRIQTPRMLDNINSKTKETKERQPSLEYDTTLQATLEEIIETIDGKKPNFVLLPDWIKNLPMKDTNTLLQYADKLNNCIGLDPQVKVACKNCTFEYDTTFKSTVEFFRPALVI